jgi:hypothetical protein
MLSTILLLAFVFGLAAESLLRLSYDAVATAVLFLSVL